MSRVAKGVYSARRLETKPSCIPNSRPRGAKGAGVRYEKAFSKALGANAQRGVWFEYSDQEGKFYCQVDALIEMNNLAVILECKYTWTPAAFGQIELLYVPVLRRALNKPVIGLQVCKRLLPASTENGCRVVGHLGNGLILANEGHRVALHWLEKTPIQLMPSQQQLAVIQARKELLDA